MDFDPVAAHMFYKMLHFVKFHLQPPSKPCAFAELLGRYLLIASHSECGLARGRERREVVSEALLLQAVRISKRWATFKASR
eukprot:1370577-Amphidinium_carterae.1